MSASLKVVAEAGYSGRGGGCGGQPQHLHTNSRKCDVIYGVTWPWLLRYKPFCNKTVQKFATKRLFRGRTLFRVNRHIKEMSWDRNSKILNIRLELLWPYCEPGTWCCPLLSGSCTNSNSNVKGALTRMDYLKKRILCAIFDVNILWY